MYTFTIFTSIFSTENSRVPAELLLKSNPTSDQVSEVSENTSFSPVMVQLLTKKTIYVLLLEIELIWQHT